MTSQVQKAGTLSDHGAEQDLPSDSTMPAESPTRQDEFYRGAVSGGVTRPPWTRAYELHPGHTEFMAAERTPGGGTELGRFLTARRTQVSPAEVGLGPSMGVRRTPGLRREEVATLSGVTCSLRTPEHSAGAVLRGKPSREGWCGSDRKV